MKKNRFIAIIVIMLLALVSVFVTACAGDGENTPTPQTPGTQTEQGGGTQNSGGTSEPQASQFTVTYHAQGGKFTNGSDTLTQTAGRGSLLTSPETPKRSGCTFSGWATGIDGLTLWQFGTDTVTKNTDLYAVWEQNAAALVSVEGATVEGLSVFMLVDHDVKQVPLTNKVTCSDGSVWSLYYDNLGQVPIPTKIAASLTGELINGNNVFYVLVSTLDGTKSNVYELTIHRSYEVSIGYYFGQSSLKDVKIYTGETFEASYVPTITGYTFNGWKDIDGKAVNSFTVWEAQALYADVTANKYKATFDVAGGDDLSIQEKELTYDSEFSLPVPKRTGYSFTGWYYGNTQITGNSGAGLDKWKYDSSRRLTAHWQANNYMLTVKSNNNDAGTVEGGGEHAYDSRVTITASTKAGYTFVGWYKGSERVSTELSYSFDMGLAETYTAKWIKCPVTIESSDTAHGEVSGMPEKTILGQSITVKATANLGYVFLGWYDNETRLAESLEYTFDLNEETKKLVAKFDIAPELKKFEYNLTATTCSITGIKDKSTQDIVVPEYVTSISFGAFNGCGSLTSVKLKNGQSPKTAAEINVN